MSQNDQIDGLPVWEKPALNDIAPAKITRFWFPVVGTNVGQQIYLPVIHISGAKPGPRLLIANGVQGEHLNGLLVIQRLLDRIDPLVLSGSLLILPQINIPALQHGRHNIISNTNGGISTDLNRLFPGDVNGSSMPEVYAGRVWSHLIEGNVDVALDLHTPVEGLEYPYFVFADCSIPEVRALAEQLTPDLIKDDPGERGTLETELNACGIPCLTVELNSPRIFQNDVADRCADGVLNVMVARRMLDGHGAPDRSAILARDLHVVTTRTGGIAEVFVETGAPIAKGDPVAFVRDAFGRVREMHKAPVDGIVLARATDPLRETGAVLARIIVPC